MVILKTLSDKINRLKIKNKLLIFIVVPFVALTIIGSSQIQYQYNNYRTAKQSNIFIKTSLILETLVLDLQRERGITEGYLGSKGEQLKAELDLQRIQTDQQIESFNQFKSNIFKKNWFSKSQINSQSINYEFQQFLDFIDELKHKRAEIDVLDSVDSFNFYSNIISGLINKIEQVQIVTSDIVQVKLTNDFIKILWLQERSGQERGAFNGILSSNQLDYGNLKNVLNYISAQNNLIDQILSATDNSQQRQVHAVLNSSENKQIIEIRKQVQKIIFRYLLISDLKSLINVYHLTQPEQNKKQKEQILQLINDIKTHYIVHPSDNQALQIISKWVNLHELDNNNLENTYNYPVASKNDLISNTAFLDALSHLESGRFNTSNRAWWQITTKRIHGFNKINNNIHAQLEHFSNSRERESINDLIINILLIVITFTISFVLSYLILARLVGEITKISQAMTQIKNTGHFDQKLKISGNDEISTMALAYNNLLDERQISEQRTRISLAVFEHASEAILISNADNLIELVNPAFIEITGYSQEEVTGKSPIMLSSGRHDKKFHEDVSKYLNENDIWQGEMWNRRKNDEIYPVFLAISVVKDNKNNILQYISLFSDITKYKQYEQDIWYQANFDSLSNLPNRNLFLNRLEHELELMKRAKQKLAIMFIDLDRFKYVNDTYGHSYGDELIVTIAKRLSACLRKSDTVSRFGGDEFVVLASNIDDEMDTEKIARNILKASSKPVKLSNGKEAIVTASIGIAIFPENGDDVEKLLINGDIAMYQAKSEGKNTFCYYTPTMNSITTEHMQLEIELRRAIKNQEFILHFQPVLSLKNNHIVGLEALLRWQHPDKGLVFPDAFIKRAEETGLIVEIGEQVFSQAAKCLNYLHELGYLLYIAVNVSGRQCLPSNKYPIEQVIADTIATYNIKPEYLKIEITESMLIEDNQYTKDTLQAIKDLNIDIYMDDFGTGYSSLSYLKQFPIDVLKIDRSFIWKMLEDEADGNLVEAIIMIGQSLHLDLVAEGVESQEHLDTLNTLGCDYAQGYHISRPFELERIIEFLNETNYLVTKIDTDNS